MCLGFGNLTSPRGREYRIYVANRIMRHLRGVCDNRSHSSHVVSCLNFSELSRYRVTNRPSSRLPNCEMLAHLSESTFSYSV